MGKTLAILLVALGLASSASSARTGRVAGRVTDASDGTPLAGAAVFIEGTALGTVTGSDGAYTLDRVPAGRREITANLIGYRPERRAVDVAAESTIEIAFALRPTAIQSRPLVVTASRRPQELSESPTSVDVVATEAIAGRNVATVQGALDYVPGTTMIGGQISIRGSSGFTQGAGSRVSVLLDGVPVLSGDVGDVKWGMLPPEIVDRVEVMKGAGSALYGSAALGGVVNQITLRPKSEPETRVRLVGGTYARPDGYVAPPGGRRIHSTLSLTHTRALAGTELLGSFRREADDGARAGGDHVRYTGFLKLLRPWAGGEIGLMGLSNHEDHGQALQSYPDSLHYTRSNGNRVIGPDQFAALWVRRVIGANLSVQATGGVFRSEFEERTPEDAIATSSDAITALAEGQIVWIAAPGLTLTGGGSYSRAGVDATLFRGTRIADAGVYAQAEYRVARRGFVSAGLRHDRRTSDVAPASDQLNPRIGALVKVTRTTSLRAVVSRGFRGPTIAELSTHADEGDIAVRPNPSLAPERAWSYEAGASQIVGRRAAIDFTAFYSRYHDLIEPTIQDSTEQSTGKLVAAFTNVGRARIRGFESAVRASAWGDRLLAQASYMFLDTRNEEPGASRAIGADTLRLAYRPRHTFRAGCELRLGRYFAGYDYRYVGTYPVSVYPSDPRVPQIAHDARAGLSWRNYRLTLAATNLANYVSAARERNLSNPRRWSLSLDATY